MKSMDSIDVTNRKPRRFKGTPTYKIRNYAALAVAAYTLISGALYMFSPLSRNVRNNFEVLSEARQQELEDTTEEERLKNKSMFFAYEEVLNKKRLGDQIKEAEKTQEQ